MQIQIITNQKKLSIYKSLSEKVDSVLQEIKQEFPIDDLSWNINEKIELEHDVYIEIFTPQKLNLGFWPAADDLTRSKIVEKKCSNKLRWIVINDTSTKQDDFVSNFLLFIIGVALIPNQFGAFMTDWADMRITLLKGREARFISCGEIKNNIWPDSKTILSSIMLLNKALSLSSKLKDVAELIPKKLLNQDYLNVMNITNSKYLPPTNMILLIY